MDNKRIQTSELDFDDIKANLKEYLRGQSDFSDYDFEGSGMNVLLDVLAYNTHYNALYNNLAVNESFLDSASKRNSVVSKAKELGYVPRGSRSSEALLSLTVNASSLNTIPTFLTLPKNSPFVTNIDGTGYIFYTYNEYVAKNIDGVYSFPDVVIKEGQRLSFKYTVQEGQRYIIPNPRVDLSTIRVTVQESVGSVNYTIYYLSTDITTVDGTSTSFFVKELDNGIYELEFGNNTVGKSLTTGNVVHIEYTSCNEDIPNNASVFSYQGSSLLGLSPAITTLRKSYLGSKPEDISSIKYTAPRFYSSQNRGVTADDYKTLIKKNFPDISTINVWGGDQNNPPVYGKVFICVKPTAYDYLTQSEKDYILNTILRQKGVATITPEFVDATYLNISLDVTAYYNEANTNRTAQDIYSIILDVISQYNDDVQEFDSKFRYSVLMRKIDESDPSITNNITTLTATRMVDIYLNVPTRYEFSIANPVYNSGLPEQSVLSNALTVTGLTGDHYIEDIPTEGNPVGVLILYTYVNGVKKVVNTVGTINYTTGSISIPSLTLSGATGGRMSFTFKTQSNDIISYGGQLINIDLLNTKITILPNTTIHTFTSSRN